MFIPHGELWLFLSLKEKWGIYARARKIKGTKTKLTLFPLNLSYGCPGTSYVDHTGLELVPASASVLASKVCTTTSSSSGHLGELRCYTVIYFNCTIIPAAKFIKKVFSGKCHTHQYLNCFKSEIRLKSGQFL